MDGWNTSFLLGWPIFRCYVSFSEGRYTFFTCWGQSVFFIFDSSFSSLKTCAACFGDNPVPVFQMSFCTRLAVSNFYPKRLSIHRGFVCIQNDVRKLRGDASVTYLKQRMWLHLNRKGPPGANMERHLVFNSSFCTGLYLLIDFDLDLLWQCDVC